MADRVALVTGAQQGIGAACALALARAGCDVAVNWLGDEALADAVALGVRAAGRRAVTVRGDVGVVAECGALVRATLEAFGRIDVLVNNAGIFPRSFFLEMTEAEWDQVLAVNLRGSAFCAQAAARAMVAAGTPGVIVNLRRRRCGARRSASTTAPARTAWSASPARWRWRWRRTASG